MITCCCCCCCPVTWAPHSFAPISCVRESGPEARQSAYVPGSRSGKPSGVSGRQTGPMDGRSRSRRGGRQSVGQIGMRGPGPGLVDFGGPLPSTRADWLTDEAANSMKMSLMLMMMMMLVMPTAAAAAAGKQTAQQLILMFPHGSQQ